jgi:hypothetical protein
MSHNHPSEKRDRGAITYSLVANGTIVLCEAYVNPGPFTVIARRILPRIPPTAHKKSYAYEGLVFEGLVDQQYHYTYYCKINTQFLRIPWYIRQRFDYIADEFGLIVMCMSDEKKTPYRICFNFLNVSTTICTGCSRPNWQTVSSNKQEIRSRFLGSYEREYKTGTELAFNDRFTRTLRERMVCSNRHKDSRRSSKLIITYKSN